ncbi:sensor [Planomonospora sp. ID67723]|uniref:sensor histidine kinase n=1 Tax=Planomonospora sp. ID67723 TaxID=2738134 RepID=UPI0018C38F0F|nr:nitrate- and nitrite sensing domain-containing protein [Planomonospora sp. ID67723]MBG0827172.1 sensor [Planomonospora sp. ID67723]
MASSRSIRFKVSVLLAIPLTSLVALWGFSAVTTVGDAVGMLNVATLDEAIIRPGDALLGNLQREHLLSAEYLATRSEADRSTLIGQRTVTDQARARLREESAADSVQSALTPEMKVLFDSMMTRIEQLDALRARIDEDRIGITELTEKFALMPDVFQRLTQSMAIDNDPETRGVIMLGYSKDFLTRQRAIAAGALAVERPLSPEELRLFSRFAATHSFLMKQGLADLSSEELRAPFAEVAASPLHDRFMAMEERLLSGATVPHSEWRSVTDQLEAAFQTKVTAATVILVERAGPPAITIFVKAGVAGFVGLLAVIASLVVSYRVGRGLTRELGGVRQAATEVAEVRLPRVMERLRRGQAVDAAAEAPPLEPLGSTAEVHAVTAAFDSVRRRALDAAVEQARLREGVAQSFRNLARRKQSLLQRQLKLLDGMQKQTEDPETLEALFKLDHLTTRMRRHAEGLVILSGGAAGRKWRSAVPMEDVLRGAAAQVEDYARVRIYPMPGSTLTGGAVADLMHLFAEIIENATVFSPPGAEVSVRGELVGRGFAVEIEDRGLGLAPEKRDAINARLASPPEFDPAETDRLGFAVIGILAARYGINVVLRSSPYGGTGVVVLIPETLLGEPEPVQPPRPKAGAVAELAGASAPGDTAEPARSTGQVPARAHAATDVWRTSQRRNGGLPRRVRQTNMSPRLRQEPEAVPAAGPETGPLAGTGSPAAAGSTAGAETSRNEERSPEEARALLSSLQSGWRRGRSESEHNGGEGA